VLKVPLNPKFPTNQPMESLWETSERGFLICWNALLMPTQQCWGFQTDF